MSYFGDNTLEQNILEDVLAWQESFGSPNKEVALALMLVLKFFVEDIVENEE